MRQKFFFEDERVNARMRMLVDMLHALVGRLVSSVTANFAVSDLWFTRQTKGR
jgi:hypothetical protein